MDFIIYGPNWSRRSAGIRSLHRLGWILKQKGHNVTLAGRERYDNNWGKLVNPEEPLSLWNGDKNGIIIYPDIIPDNPLQFKKEVIWVLGSGGGGLTTTPDALHFTWSYMYGFDLEELYVPIVDERYFNLNSVGNRHLILSYKTNRVPGDIELTDYYPDSWDKLADMLKKARYLRCGDNFTCLHLESKLCGCPVILTNYDNSINFDNEITAGMVASENDWNLASSDLPRFYNAYQKYKDKSNQLVDNFIIKCEEKWG